MQKGLHVNSPSTFRGKSMMDAPLRAEMMVTAGVPLLRIMIATKRMAFVLKLVSGVSCVVSYSHNI